MTIQIKKVLIIDDDEISNFITSSILEQSHKVNEMKVVESADEGISYLNELIEEKLELPNLILLDIKMPVKSGWDFIEDFKKIASNKRKGVRIVMLSSSVYPDDVYKAKTFKEVSGYVSKPITSEKLDDIIVDYII